MIDWLSIMSSWITVAGHMERIHLYNKVDLKMNSNMGKGKKHDQLIVIAWS